MTITQQAEQFTNELQALKTQLEILINCNYYLQLTSTGFYVVDFSLVDALDALNQTLDVNEWVRNCLTSHPENDIKSAIAKTLENVNTCTTYKPMSKFAHFKTTELELIIDLDGISYVSQTSDITWVHFRGDQNSLCLKGETAQAVWEYVKEHSLSIHETAAENKNAETHTS